MTKDDFQRFYVDLLTINDNDTLFEKTKALYEASYMAGGQALEERIFGVVEGYFKRTKALLELRNQIACRHYDVPDLGDEFAVWLTESDKVNLFDNLSTNITK